MSRMIQVRNVPNALHRKMKARAAMAGMSLSQYVLRELRRSAEIPTMEEMRKRLERLEPVVLNEPAATAVRAVRAERERALSSIRRRRAPLI